MARPATAVRAALRRVSARSWRGIAALATPFALGLALAGWSGAASELTPQRLQAEVLALGAGGLAGYLAASAVRPVFVVLSGSLFAVGAGLVWGPWIGAAVALGGAALSTCTVFGLVRGFGAGAVRELAGARYERLSELARRRGFLLVFIATLGFLFPTDVVIAVASASGVRWRTVLVATTLGSFPGTLAMATIGATAVRPTPTMWLVGATAVVGLTIIAGLLARALLPRPRPALP